MASHTTLLFIGGLGGWEVFLILFAILLLFGAKRIPELARGLGRGIREFKEATNDIKKEIDDEAKDLNKSIQEASNKNQKS